MSGSTTAQSGCVSPGSQATVALRCIGPGGESIGGAFVPRSGLEGDIIRDGVSAGKREGDEKGEDGNDGPEHGCLFTEWMVVMRSARSRLYWRLQRRTGYHLDLPGNAEEAVVTARGTADGWRRVAGR